MADDKQETKTVSLSESLRSLIVKIETAQRNSPSAGFAAVAKRAGFSEKKLIHLIRLLNENFNLGLEIKDILTTEDFLTLLRGAQDFIERNSPTANQKIRSALVPNKETLKQLTKSLDEREAQRKAAEEKAKRLLKETYGLTDKEAAIAYSELRRRWAEVLEKTLEIQGRKISREQSLEKATNVVLDPAAVRETLREIGAANVEIESKKIAEETEFAAAEAAAYARVKYRFDAWRVNNPEQSARQYLKEKTEETQAVFVSRTDAPSFNQAQVTGVTALSLTIPHEIPEVLSKAGFLPKDVQVVSEKISPSPAKVLIAQRAVAFAIEGEVERTLQKATVAGKPIEPENLPVLTREISSKIAGGLILAKARKLDQETAKPGIIVGPAAGLAFAAKNVQLPQEEVPGEEIRVRKILDRASILQWINTGLPRERKTTRLTAEEEALIVPAAEIISTQKKEIGETILTFFKEIGLDVTNPDIQQAATAMEAMITAPCPPSAQEMSVASAPEQINREGKKVGERTDPSLVTLTIPESPARVLDTLCTDPMIVASWQSRLARLPLETVQQITTRLKRFNLMVFTRSQEAALPRHFLYTAEKASDYVLNSPSFRFFAPIRSFFTKISEIPFVQRFINLPVVNYFFHPLQTLAQRGWQKFESFFARRAVEGIAKKIGIEVFKKGTEAVIKTIASEGLKKLLAAATGGTTEIINIVSKIMDVLHTKDLASKMTGGISKLFRAIPEKIPVIGGIIGNAIDAFFISITTIPLAFLAPVIIGVFAVLFLLNSHSSQMFSSFVGNKTAFEEGGEGGYAPADPIFGEDCASTTACAVYQFLTANGISYIDEDNVYLAADLLGAWSNPPPVVNLNYFINMMIANVEYMKAHYAEAGYDKGYFMCIGFSLACDPNLSMNAGWGQLYAGNVPGCSNIAPEDAGIGDHVVYPLTNGHYHIAELTTRRTDDTFVITEANWGGHGEIGQSIGYSPNGLKFVNYANGANHTGDKLTILRCR